MEGTVAFEATVSQSYRPFPSWIGKRSSARLDHRLIAINEYSKREKMLRNSQSLVLAPPYVVLIALFDSNFSYLCRLPASSDVASRLAPEIRNPR
jgi:hypothetical protein